MQAVWILWGGQHYFRWRTWRMGVLSIWFYCTWWWIYSVQGKSIRCYFSVFGVLITCCWWVLAILFRDSLLPQSNTIMPFDSICQLLIWKKSCKFSKAIHFNWYEWFFWFVVLSSIYCLHLKESFMSIAF